MRHLICLLVILFCINTPYSQCTLKGKLIAEDNIPVSYATISVLSQTDSLIQGTITDEKGKFEIDNLPFGEYKMNANFLGFQEYSIDLKFDTKQQNIKLGELIMQANEQVLDEVLIRAEKSQYVNKMDKKIFNVGKDILAQGGSALDVLSQVPQVTVQPTGAIELRGNSSVQILINGRRSGMAMGDALEQLDIDNIEKIEVITNPSASFDASGSAGIINIVLKRAKGEGLKSQIRATVGTPANYILMPGISFKGEKLNLFGNVRWRYSDYNGLYTIDQQNTGLDNTFSLKSNEVEDRHDDGKGYYAGGDYYFNDNTSLTMAYYRSDTKDSDETNIEYSLEESESITSIKRNGISVENRSYNQLESGFEHKIGKSAKKLSTYVQYDFWDSNKDWNLTTTSDQLPENIPANLKTDNVAGSKDLALQVDYEHPFEKGKLEVGVKWEGRTVENDYKAETLQDKTWTIYQGIDNDIKYGENIAAAYTKYQGQLLGIEYQFGLRAEHSDIQLSDNAGEYGDKKDYLNFFPSAFLSRQLSEGTSIQGGYSRRINRPSLWDLYPFSELTDINVIQTGNPNLDPGYTDGLEVSLSTRLGSFRINPGVYYKQTSGAFESYLEQNNDGFFIVKPVNIDQFRQYGLEFFTQYRPMDELSISGEFNYERFDQSGMYNDQDMSAEGDSWWTRVNTRVNLGIVRFQASYRYYGPRKNAQIDYLSSSDLSLSGSTSLFDDQLEVGVRVSNVLDTRIRRSIATSSDYTVEQSARRYGARASLNLTYKFNYGNRDRMRQANRGNR